VTGTLPVANGGTGLTASGASGNLLVSDGSALASVSMSNDATLASTGALTLKNTGTAGTYGSASVVPVIVTDQQGRVTSVTNTNISIGGSAFGSQTANTVLAAPNGSSGNPSFRALVAADLPSLSSVYLPLSGGTMSALSKLTVAASTAAGAGLSLGSTLGTAPSSPVQGDIWTISTGAVFISTAGVTQQFITSAPVTNVNIQPGSTAGARTIDITAGTNTTASGTGGAFTLAAGQGGVGGTCGTLTLRGGAAGSGGTAGSISIGATSTASISIGASGITTTVAGTLAAVTAAVDTNSTQVATTAYVIGQGYLTSATAASAYAPLASPTFTGTVTIPAGASISGFAPLASPTFTGTPSLPTGTTGVTQSAGNNTTALATTAFVTAAVAAAAGTPYDLPLEIPGTPALSTKVVNFDCVRPFILSTTGHQGGQLTNPSGNFVCTVRKNLTTLGTITFAAGGFSSSITATLTDRTFAVGEVLSVETPAAALGIDTPHATLVMSLV
jgi:hypothetical protein